MLLCMCNVIPKVNTERPKQKDTVKYIYRQIDKSKQNFFKKMVNLQGDRKKDNREPKQRGQIENK